MVVADVADRHYVDVFVGVDEDGNGDEEVLGHVVVGSVG